MKECKICHRIEPKKVRNTVYKICSEMILNRKEKHILFKKTLDIILFLDKNSFILCGKSQKSIIGSCLYISGILTGIRDIQYNTSKSILTQRQISKAIHITECAIRVNYIKFLSVLKSKKYINIDDFYEI